MGRASEEPSPIAEGWTSTATNLRASLDVLELSDGQISVPPNLTHTVIEIGCNGHGLAWDSPFTVGGIDGISFGVPLSKQPNVLLVSFEPLLDKYANYLALEAVPKHITQLNKKPSKLDQKQWESALWRQIEQPPALGWSVPGRAIVLPFAVGKAEGTATFHVSKSDGCSSLLPIDAATMKFNGRHDWMKGFMEAACGQGAAERRVPVVSLGTILDRWLPGRRIDYLKIDAQGYDLQVLLSASPDSLARVGALELEVTSSDLKLPYKGADSCVETLGNLTALGFHAVSVDKATGKRSFLKNICRSTTFHGSTRFVRTSKSDIGR